MHEFFRKKSKTKFITRILMTASENLATNFKVFWEIFLNLAASFLRDRFYNDMAMADIFKNFSLNTGKCI